MPRRRYWYWNVAAESALSAQVAAHPEKVTTYEVGTKVRSTPHRLSLSAAAFYNDYQDFQLDALNPESGQVQTTNIANARVFGVEAQMQACVEELRAHHRVPEGRPQKDGAAGVGACAP